MMKTNLHHQCWILPYCIVLCAVAIILGAVIWINLAFHQAIDLSNKTPDQAFHFIFKMPVPAEVYNVKVAGEASLSGNMWMRFKLVGNLIVDRKNNTVYAWGGLL